LIKNHIRAFFVPQVRKDQSTSCHRSANDHLGTALPKGEGLKSLRALFPDLDLGKEVPGVPTMYFGTWEGAKRGQKC